ncbi:MAG: helix-turn-helix domain-containing protein [Chloroflexota bacterium]
MEDWEKLLNELVNESESATLDFKEEQYKFIKASDEVKSELLKDILAFANAFRRNEAYILIGFKDGKGNRAETVGIYENLDDANLQQFVNSKINKPLEFSYHQITFEGKKIGVIKIPIQDRGFYLTKKFGSLEKTMIPLRKGSSTGYASNEEFEQMIKWNHSRNISKPNLEIQFDQGENVLVINVERFNKMSEEDVENKFFEFKKKYPKLLIHEDYKHQNKSESKEKDDKLDTKIQPSLNPVFKGVNASALSAAAELFSSIHPKLTNLALYNSLHYGTNEQRNEYNQYLDKQYDKYYKYLAKLQKYVNHQIGIYEVNIIIHNTGNESAHDIDIELQFPNEFEVYLNKPYYREPVAPNKPLKYRNMLGLPYGIMDHLDDPFFDILYPPYEAKAESAQIDLKIDKIKHHSKENLDTIFIYYKNFDSIKDFKIDYKINADNLKEIITGSLAVNFIKEI